ncbi:MAG: hypothetical protein J6W40_04145 [Alphaproteobacteria bacterium]|nr:hypothetical protein [Alphaproteobacteria bacterium]
MSKAHKITFYPSNKIPRTKPYTSRTPFVQYPLSQTPKGTKATLNQLLLSSIKKKKHAEKVETKTPKETPKQPEKTVAVISYVESFVEEEEYTASQTSKNIVSLNGRFLHIRDGYTTIQNLTNLAKTMEPEPHSCIRAIESMLDNGTFVLITEFNMKTKCTDWMDEPSDETKQKLCRKFSCAGECIDADMRKILALILPEIYGTTQR